MWVVNYLLVPLLLCGLVFGHFALWVMVINRLHATGLPRLLIKAIDKLIYLIVLGLPALGLYSRLTAPPELYAIKWAWLDALLNLYLLLCLCVGFVVSLKWLERVTGFRRPKFTALVRNDTALHNAAADLGYRPVHGWRARVASRLPLNQIFELHVNVRTLLIPNLPPKLDGLSIAHLSDIHMTGRITQPYFDYVVDRANELDADLVCITGDIVEKEPCLAWIEPTLGRLRARHGKFFVLGNHDKRMRDVAAVRGVLVDSGLVDLGGQWIRQELRGENVLFAGNELPWFGPAPSLPSFIHVPAEESEPFRILLSHSPDQIYWAMLRDFNLMLAGHNHGGQICLPLVGPLVSPSYFGVKYASGLFQEGPTLLHVSRGVSGLEPLRFNCPPEITKLVLVKEMPTRS